MPSTSPCIPSCCSTPLSVAVPGPEGNDGTPGQDGLNGNNAYTTVALDFTVPAAGATVTVTVGNALWMVPGQNIFIQGPANFTVSSVIGATAAVLTFLGYTGDVSPGATIGAGAGVVGSGVQFAPGSLPSSLTNNSGGTIGTVIAAGVGIYILTLPIQAAAIANGDLVSSYVPGHAFKILKADARCTKPVTTGGKSSSISLKIDSTSVTGGVISLAGTYTQGSAQAGSLIAGQNTGTNVQAITLFASATTTFIEGEFAFLLEIQNLDSANAFASLTSSINALITALT